MENQPDRLTDDELRVRAEEKAAAGEAGGIGGEGSDEEIDPAERPVREAGGGEAEGFEQAEAELAENAGHGEGNPLADEFGGEAESDRTGAEYGEADEAESVDR